MTRKSASSFKAVKKQQLDELPSIEETFNNHKQVFINTLETSIIIAERVDNLMNIRDYAYKFWGSKLDEKFLPDERLKYLMALMDLSINTYRQLLDKTMEFDMDEFLKNDMKDYFEDIIPKVNELKTEEDLCEAGLIFLTVKPFGEKMTALHHTMLDEKKQREYLETGN